VERARKHNQEEIELRNTLSLMVEGSKAYSKGGRIGNALPLMVEGLKASSKRNEVRARRHTQKEVG
jgi:selenophosphate synthetase-related protein